MKGNLNLSIKLANKKYNYISPKQPGTIPKGIIINKKKYILIPLNHTAICDSVECQRQGIIYYKKPKKSNEYSILPIYSNWGNDEICLVCANIDKLIHFTPTKNETNRLINIIFNSNSLSESDECNSNEGDSISLSDSNGGDSISMSDSDELNNEMKNSSI